jgi:hypothetical protein
MNASIDTEYGAYDASGSSQIPYESYKTYQMKAWYLIQDITGKLCDTVTDDYSLSILPEAVFRVADALYAEDNGSGITSESIGGYSYSKQTSESLNARIDPMTVARRALSGSPLNYTGINTPAGDIATDKYGFPL